MKYLTLRIHKGSNEIGGTCIQLTSDNTTIILDFGLPLKNDDALPNYVSSSPNAVLISHPHQDHFGLIDKIDPHVPVYIGKLAKALIDSTRMLLSKELHTNNFQFFKDAQMFQIGDFTITPYLVDHSAVDAYGFLIEAHGMRVFYSGDFRAHGRKSILFDKIVNAPPKKIDLLFMEGTMIERNNDDFPTEVDVEKKIFDTINDQKNISFLISSSQNIDRIVSAYRACIRAGKNLIIDIYTAWVLEQLKRVSDHVPSMEWDLIKVYADYSQDKKLKEHPEFFGDFRKRLYKHRIKKEEIQNNPSHYLFFGRMSRYPIMNLYKEALPLNVIYSQWLGYLKCNNNEYYGAEHIAAYSNDPQVNFVYAHTSGHAMLEDLKTFADALNSKNLVPIHTEHRDKFTHYFENVTVLEDGKNYMLTDDGDLLGMDGVNYLLKRMADIRDRIDRGWISDHLKTNEIFLHKIITILDEIDPYGIARFCQQEGEYAPEAKTILLRQSEWETIDNLEKIVAEEFAWWFGDYDADGNVKWLGSPDYKVAARQIWNAWLELKGEPPVLFKDTIELPQKSEPITIMVE